MKLRRMSTLLVCFAIAAGLGACREEEKQRPLSHEKGVYSGQKGTPLTDEQQRQLRQRNRRQADGGL